MEATASSVFGGEDAYYVPEYKREKGYGPKEVYNEINEIYNATVKKFITNLEEGGYEEPLFTYEYEALCGEGRTREVQVEVSCKCGMIYVKDDLCTMTICAPGSTTLSRTREYLTALYRNMGYLDFKNVEIAK